MGLQFRKLHANLHNLTSHIYRVQYFHFNFFTWNYLPINPGSSRSYPVSTHYMYDTFYLIIPLNSTLLRYLPSSKIGTLLVNLIFYYRLGAWGGVMVKALRY